ncbi:branched-chain amino acid ABC transporter permease [Halobacteriaceae archaeon GCM10025711]
MPAILQYVVNGIVYSSIIVLASIGLSLVYSIADFANFAHGDTMTVGAYGALLVMTMFGGADPGVSILGIPVTFFLALLVGMALAPLVALATERVIYKPLDVDSIGLLITSIGVAFVYRAGILLGFPGGFQSYGIQRQGPIPAIQDAFGVAVTVRNLTIVVVSVILVVGLHLLLQYTTLGRKMRATADNADLARVSGIRTDQIIVAMWVIGAGLAAAGGVFLGLHTHVHPRMGFDILLVVFAAVILGGIGSVYGAMLGGLVIGMVHELTPLLAVVGIPDGTKYSASIAFVIMVVILLVRPSGIMGGEAA